MKTLIVINSLILLTVLAVPTDAQDFEVSQEGKWRIWYTSPDLRAELSYHWADKHLGDEWLILKLSIAGGRGGVTSVARENIHLRAPDGTKLALPTEPEFRAVRGPMQMAFRQEDSWGPAASRFVGSLKRAEEWFYSPVGMTIHREVIHPSAFLYCTGPLVFEVPGGVQPGTWTLLIDLEEMRAEIPFELGANEK